MPKKLSYWKRRQVQDSYEMFQKAEDLANEIGDLYNKASEYIAQQAEAIFDRFRRKYGLSEEDALALMNTLHDQTSVDEMLSVLQNNPGKEEREALKRELTSAAFRARIERLKELQNNLDALMEQIGIQQTGKSTNLFRKIIEEAYNRHMYNLQQRIGIHFDFSQISKDAVERILKSNWSGEHYSKRIWKNTRKLARRLKKELLFNMITGRTLHETIKKLMELFHVGYREARRLILTETSHVMNEADEKAREEAGVDMYMYLATLDLRTSKICRSLDGQIFKVSEREVGKNFPPMHPHCRSTTIDYFGEEWIKEQSRIARDPKTGKNIKVPMSMTYEEWYKTYVEGSPEAEAKEKAIRTKSANEKQHKRYREVLGDKVPETLEEFRKMKEDPERWKELKAEYRRTIKKDKTLDAAVKSSSANSASELEKYESTNTDEKIRGGITTEAEERQIIQQNEEVSSEKQETVDALKQIDDEDSPEFVDDGVSENEKTQDSEEEEWPEDIVITNTWKDTGEFNPDYEDITDEALSNVATNMGPVEEITDFVQDGKRYTVDNKEVKLKHSPDELATAKLLQEKLGLTVKMMPEVNGSKRHVKTPDFLINGERWDRKGIEKVTSKKPETYFTNKIHHNYEQAENYIFDITNKCNLTDEFIIKQIKEIFSNYNLRFVNTVILTKENQILLILKRK